MQDIPTAPEQLVAPPSVAKATCKSRFPLFATVSWCVFLLSALLPCNAVWQCAGDDAWYLYWSIDFHEIDIRYSGIVHRLPIYLAPFVILALGLILALRRLPKHEFWRPLQCFHLGLLIAVGEGLLFTVMLGSRTFFLGGEAFAHAYVFARSAAEVLWFYGLFMERLKKWPALAVATTSVLFALWHVSFAFRPLGTGLDTDFGIEKAIVIAFAAVPFGIARLRGVSLVSLALAAFSVSWIVQFPESSPSRDVYHLFREPLAVCLGYICLVVLVSLFPVSFRPFAWVRFRGASLPAALAIVAGCIPFLREVDKPGKPKDQLTREEALAAELNLLGATYPAKHLDFEKRASPRVFQERCRELGISAGKLSNSELVLELRRLLAELRVDHSVVYHPWKDGYEIKFDWLSDGLIVGPVDHPAADPRSKALRVLRIGSMTPEKAVSLVAPFISHENENWLRERSVDLIKWRPLLEKLGIVAADGILTLSCADAAGTTHEVKLSPSPSGAVRSFTRKSLRPSLISSVTPEALETAEGYWGGMLVEKPTALYLRFDDVNDGKPNQFGSFGDFVNGMLHLAESHSATEMIIDLRFNRGGYFDSIAPLLFGLNTHRHLAFAKRVRVLIGGGTFSAAVFYAAALKQEFGAVLIGEETGGGLTVYADPQTLKLPYSNVEVTYPRRKISASFGARGPLKPDVFVKRCSYSEFCKGRDPQIDAAAKL